MGDDTLLEELAARLVDEGVLHERREETARSLRCQPTATGRDRLSVTRFSRTSGRASRFGIAVRWSVAAMARAACLAWSVTVANAAKSGYERS
jgi:hypothetical protein